MKDKTPLIHAAIALVLQIGGGILLGDWLLGGAIGCAIFIAREHTQAEYRWIEKYGQGLRANMPWRGGFDLRVWDIPSVLDFAIPVVVCTTIAFITC